MMSISYLQINLLLREEKFATSTEKLSADVTVYTVSIKNIFTTMNCLNYTESCGRYDTSGPAETKVCELLAPVGWLGFNCQCSTHAVGPDDRLVKRKSSPCFFLVVATVRVASVAHQDVALFSDWV